MKTVAGGQYIKADGKTIVNAHGDVLKGFKVVKGRIVKGSKPKQKELLPPGGQSKDD